MNVTSIRVILMENRNEHEHGLLAALTLTVDGDFVIHDVKVVRENRNGRLIVTMPQRVVLLKCPACGENCPALKLARFCQMCGKGLPADFLDALEPHPETGRIKRFVDLIHPITQECRRRLEDLCLAAYSKALEEAAGGAGRSLASLSRQAV